MCYLKEYHRGTYINLLTSGRLNTYLVEIDKQAQERFERLVEGMKQAQGMVDIREPIFLSKNVVYAKTTV